MINLFKKIFQSPPEEKLPVKAWLINPVTKTVGEIDSPHVPSLISEAVGKDAEAFKLDNNNNVLWLSEIETNSRYAFYFEGMPYPFDVKRYSYGLVQSLGPNYWDLATIMDWLR
jgi:hypothetical protein